MCISNDLSFSNLELCSYKSKELDVICWVSLIDGKLEFSGQDLGPNVESIWGDEDYEYWYSFDEESTKRLLGEIGGEKKTQEVLKMMFGGTRGFSKLRNLCIEKGIPYSFFSYV